MAAIAGARDAEAADAGCSLFTDSQYLRQGITEWIEGWRKRGWRTADKKPVKNQDLWERLDAARTHQVDWRWLKGHAGHAENERLRTVGKWTRAQNAERLPARFLKDASMGRQRWP